MIKNILLLEDDPRFRAVFMLAVADLDCKVIQTTSIRESNVELTATKFDLLVVDGQLPDGDGLSWICKLRERKIETPVIFISAHFRDSVSFKTLTTDLGSCRVLQKPITIDVLADEIRNILEPTQRAAPIVLSTDLMEEFAALATEYKEMLPEQMKQLHDNIENAKLRPMERTFINEAISIAHRLRGTAAMHGLPELGENMGRIEDMLLVLSKSVNKDFYFTASWTGIINAMSAAELSIRDCDKDNIVNSRKHVMILSQNSTFIQRLQSLLSSEGFLVYSFQDDKYVDELMMAIKPDLVICEFGNGDQSPQLEQLQKYKNISMIALANSDDPDTRNRVFNSGFNSMLTKSLSNLDLLTEISSHFKTGGKLVPVRKGDLQVA